MMKKLVVLLIGSVLLLAGGIAYASIPDAQGVIHGCYKNSTGDVRIIDSDTTTCPSGYTALNWNQTGPQGPQGPAGPAGTAGYEVVHVVVPAGPSSEFVQADCPAGKYAVNSYWFTEFNGSRTWPGPGQLVVDSADRATGNRFPKTTSPGQYDGYLVCVNG